MEQAATNNDLVLSAQIVGLIKNAWNAQTKNVTDYFNKYEDTWYEQEVAPGRNSAAYLLGHLTAANDALLSMFGLSDRLFPELEMFLTTPDKQIPDAERPTLAELRTYWEKVSATLAAHFSAMTIPQWLERHTRVSAEDFALDPKRNKLNVLLGRTTHMGYHMGQLVFLKQAALAQ